MATFIEYLDNTNVSLSSSPDLTPIGYLTMNSEQALRKLLPGFYVVDYLGISIPSRSKYENQNQGLKLSSVSDGIGLVGTIEMLEQSDLFQNCKHHTHSNEQKREIVEKMKLRISPLSAHQKPLSYSEAEKYVLIFDALGHPMSVDELVEFTIHENYFDPIPNIRF